MMWSFGIPHVGHIRVGRISDPGGRHTPRANRRWNRLLPFRYPVSGHPERTSVFVRSLGLGCVAFAESCKESGSRFVHRGGRQPEILFPCHPCNTQTVPWPMECRGFDPAFSQTIDANDAIKMMNNGENLGIARMILSVDARETQRNDTIFYSTAKLRKQSYRFAFCPERHSGNA